MYFHTHCSPDWVFRILEGLQPKQKAAIEEIGFCSLLQLWCIKIDHALCFLLVNNFNSYSYTLEVYNTLYKIVFNGHRIYFRFEGKMIENWYEQRYCNKNNLCNKYCDKNGWLPLVILGNQIKEDIDNGNDIKVYLCWLFCYAQ